MNVRETLTNRGPAVKGAIVVGLALVAGFMFWTALGGGKPRDANEAFYTTNDGRTTFVDNFFRAYPFDHDGKPAYRAYVYQTSKGNKFVGYLERYTDQGLSALEPVLSQNINPEQLRQQIQGIRQKYTEVKKPDDPNAKWYPAGSSQAADIEAVSSPDGPDDNCVLVFP
jgi:hypothetical protein